MKHHYNLQKNLGFTLAEVLITLGIIGVVAALTLPTLIHKHRIKQLEIAFKRSSSIIQNAAKDTAFEFGIDDFKKFNEICSGTSLSENTDCRNNNSSYTAEINAYWKSRFNIIAQPSSAYNTELMGHKVKNFSNTAFVYYSNLYGINPNQLYILNDGSCVTGLDFFVHNPSDGITLTFDTNGPRKGPNRYGYDVFIYNTGTWNKLCSANTDGGIYNGRGCYDYALKNENPDDSAKTYWDSLK